MKNLTKLLFAFALFFPSVGQTNFFNEAYGKAFLGLGFGDIDVTPIVFGADYKFTFEDVAFFRDNDLRLPAGILYWSESEGLLDFSILEFSAGLEKSLDMDQFILNFGGRFGFANIKTTVTVPFFGTTISDTDTSMFIAPYGEFVLPLNEQMAVGGELRLPIYFNDTIDAFDVIYLLGSFNYIF